MSQRHDESCNASNNETTELDRLNAELRTLNPEIWRSGQELSVQRRKVIPKLAKAVMLLLSDLGFSQSHFDVTIETLDQAQCSEPAVAVARFGPGHG